jgi:hypothetical protein
MMAAEGPNHNFHISCRKQEDFIASRDAKNISFSSQAVKVVYLRKEE